MAKMMAREALLKKMGSRNFPVEAVQVLLKILEIGAAKGYLPAGWRSETKEHHLKKARGHLLRMSKIKEGEEPDEDNLAHAFTRLAMAIGVREANG